VLSLAVWSTATPATALDKFWSNSRGDGSGAFNDEDNWIPDVFTSDVPGASDVAHFGMTTSSAVLPATYTVSFSTDPTNLRLVVEDDRVTFDLNGHTYRATSPIAVMLGTESGRTGRLTVTDGTVSHPFEADIQIGSVAGSSGVLNVTTGGLVLGSPELVVGVDGNGTLNITNGGDVIADDTTIGLNSGGTGAATITGASSSLTAAELAVGGMGMGTLNVLAGGRVDSTSGRVASKVNTPTATVSDAGSKWIVSEELHVGFEGRGSLSITNGGVVQDQRSFIGAFNSPGEFGFAEVKGANSKWTLQRDFTIGHVGGAGTLSITDGGLVEIIASDARVLVGDVSGGVGTVDVDGVGSRWINASDLTVGDYASDNVVNITGGGFVQNADAILGNNSVGGLHDRGTVIVSDSGSEWNASSVIVGLGGTGTLKVLAGGRVEVATTLRIANEHLGEVTVDGLNSTLVVGGELLVGTLGDGQLNITGGGRVTSSRGKLARILGSHGEVVITGSGSTWEVTDNLIGGDAFSGPYGSGTVRIENGGALNVANAIALQDVDELHLEGGALRTATIDFLGATQPFFWTSGRLSTQAIQITKLTIPSSGVLAPGRELGDTLVFGDLESSVGATTEIQLGGTTPGVTFDRVRVDGGINLLGGKLEVSLLNGFLPSSTDAFQVMSSLTGVFAGSFANIASGQRLATSDGLGSFLVSYGPGSPQVVLSAFQIGIPGDFDHDGDVDGRDFLVWQRGGSPNPLSSADLALWRANFGTGGAATAAGAVPEPRGEWLALAAIALACASRRSKSRVGWPSAANPLRD
jgi:T5SS/PEP-CTERM-associated repeat protein